MNLFVIKPWMIIGIVTILAAVVVSRFTTPQGIKWFNRLRRPAWLTFEKAIPLIWTTIFICGAWSAAIAWDANPGNWLLMGGYLLLELVTLAYSPVMMNLQSLKVGTMVGATGFLIATLLTLWVGQISSTAALLLVPYLLWSPIGTYTTWAMAPLNPRDV